MVYYNNFLEIDKIKEPNKFNIFQQIEIHGKCVIEDVDKKPWWPSVGRKIGLEANSISDGNKSRLLLPPVKPSNTNPDRIVVITPNINVIVREQKITDIKSKFIFLRK